jgi:hypothetical protein
VLIVVGLNFSVFNILYITDSVFINFMVACFLPNVSVLRGKMKMYSFLKEYHGDPRVIVVIFSTPIVILISY